MIEINETKPVEASLTIVLRGDDVERFAKLVSKASKEYWGEEGYIAYEILEAINS